MSGTAMANGSGSGGIGGGRSSRLPRWTQEEIMVLVEAKQAYERQSGSGVGRPTDPKWTFVSSQCRRQGVERGPLQCRKRWSNLACDFKKIRGWEVRRNSGGNNNTMESYWMMRSDVRREKKLPGFFDREVFELMDEDIKEEDADVVFDSGRSAREDGLFSEFELEEEEEEDDDDDETIGEPILVVPISERKYQPENEHSDPGNSNDNQQQTCNNPEKGSSSCEGQKRRRTSKYGVQETSLESKLIEVLEKNTRILSAQLEAHNLNCQLDRDQRKDQIDGLLAVMTRLADAIGRIADKL